MAPIIREFRPEDSRPSWRCGRAALFAGAGYEAWTTVVTASKAC
jgi:hypothetical protein